MENNLKILLIGFGGFGTLVASVLKKEGLNIRVLNYKNKKKDKEKAKIIGIKLVKEKDISEFDIIILATPISKTEEVIKAVSKKMKPGGLLLDTCSVKVYPCNWLKNHTSKNVQIMGTHPMFGPTTSNFDLKKQTWSLKDLQIVLCPLRIKNKHLNNIQNFLKNLGLNVIKTTPEDHDKQNAKTLSLVHFIGRSLLDAKIGKQEIFTPGYSDLLSILPHTTSDNWQLFYDMNNYNPYAKEVMENFMQSCSLIEEKIVKSNSRDSFYFNRNMIELIDNKILKLLEKRFSFAKNIGKIKQEKDLKIIDKPREERLINILTRESELSPDFIESLYKLIFKESYNIQK